MDFGGGRQLTFTVSTQSVPYQRVQILGTKGRIEIEIPFNAPPDVPTRIFVDEGTAHANRSARAIEFPAVDQYQLQGEAFSRAIREELAPRLWLGGCDHEHAHPGCAAQIGNLGCMGEGP